MYTANQADGCNVQWCSAQTKVLNIGLSEMKVKISNPFVNHFKTSEKEKP